MLNTNKKYSVLVFVTIALLTLVMFGSSTMAGRIYYTAQGSTVDTNPDGDVLYSNPDGARQSWHFDQWHPCQQYEGQGTTAWILSAAVSPAAATYPDAGNGWAFGQGSVRVTFLEAIPDGIYEITAAIIQFGTLISEFDYRDAINQDWQTVSFTAASYWANGQTMPITLFAPRPFSSVGAGQYWIEFRETETSPYLGVSDTEGEGIGIRNITLHDNISLSRTLDADLDRSGKVDFKDFAIFAEEWIIDL